MRAVPIMRASRIACRGLIGICNAGLVILEVLDSPWAYRSNQTLLVHETSANFHGLDPGRALDHALVPRLHVWKSLELLVSGNPKRCIQSVIPGNEGEVRESHAVPDQPLLVSWLGSEDPVEDAQHPFDFICVALDSGRDLFRVQIFEPSEQCLDPTLGYSSTRPRDGLQPTTCIVQSKAPGR